MKRIVIDGLPDDAPELELSRLLDQYRTAREDRYSLRVQPRSTRRRVDGGGSAAAVAVFGRGFRPYPLGRIASTVSYVNGRQPKKAATHIHAIADSTRKNRTRS